MDTKSLKRFLMEALREENQLSFDNRKIVENVMRGIALCERARIDWKKAALSFRHIVYGERMAVIIAHPRESRPCVLSSEYFNDVLKKRGMDMRDESMREYALQTEHPASPHGENLTEWEYNLQRYLWIKAAEWSNEQS